MKNNNNSILAVTAFFLALSAQALASPLAAGASTTSLVTYNSLSNPYTGNFVAGSTATASNGLWSGVLKSGVFRSAAGTLDFLYQISENAGSSAAITKLVDSSFSGFTTEVGVICYDFDGAGTSSVNFTAAETNRSALTVKRSTDGSNIGFDFGSINAVDPSHASWILVVKTNAFDFTNGLVKVVDTNKYSNDPYVNSYQPYAAATPEPATFIPIGIALIVLGYIRRKGL